MKRTLRAFLIAPLWTPLVAVVATAVGGNRPQQMVSLTETEWLLIVGGGHLVIGYLAAWTVGLGLHALLRRWRVTRLWAHVAIWFCVGLMLRALLLGATWIPTGGLAMGARETADAAMTRPLFLLAGGLVAGLMGATLWLMLRPDLARTADNLPAHRI